MRRIEEPYNGEEITVDEALRRVLKWTRAEGIVQMGWDEIGWVITDLKLAVGYMALALEALIKKEQNNA